MKNDSIIVLFGVTGDLALKKILPSLYRLFRDKTLTNTRILGVARRDLESLDILKDAKQYIPDFDEKVFKKLSASFEYIQLNFGDAEGYTRLKEHVTHLSSHHNLSNIIYYLSTSPEFYETILENIKKNKLNSSKGFVRVVLEKPFGNDLKSALRINKYLTSVFSEDQIFRIDHYLAKDVVQDMVTLRFSNRVFSPLWNKDNIDHIQIILSEDFGIRDRGGFYEKYGALKDVVQNHIVQILALTIMDNPGSYNEEFLRNQKIKILDKARISNVVIGQYEGYRKEKHVDPKSITETFAALKLFVDLPMWKSIPIYVMTGKNLTEKFSKVYVQFKESESPFLDEGVFPPNYLNFQIQPDEGFYLRLNARNPYTGSIEPVRMEYCNNCAFPNSPDAYSKLLKEVIHGNKMFFIRSDEVEAQWKIIDRINTGKLKLHTYKKGEIPKAAHDMIKKDDRSWHLKVEKAH